MDPKEMNTISVYPNPFEDFTTIYFGQELKGNYAIRIYDLLGNLVYINEQVAGSEQKIYRNEMKTGVYIFALIDLEIETEVFSTKLVIE